jgi:hypothetical protein
MNLIAICSTNPHHKKFYTVVEELVEWIVDEHGHRIETHDIIATSVPPSVNRIWTCTECGALAMVTEKQ